MTDRHDDARERITHAIKAFLSLLEQKPDDPLKGLGALARALDELVICYHSTPEVEPDTVEVPEAPRIDEGALIERASAAYPELDWYAVVEPERGPDQEVGMSMAIGDLVEIAADLNEILWLFDNASENDAIWDFRFGYQTHWGRHLHEIRCYLHTQAAW